MNPFAGSASEILDWIILTGFSVIVGGAGIYRLLANLNNWWSDD
jgi:hypothetical protein